MMSVCVILTPGILRRQLNRGGVRFATVCRRFCIQKEKIELAKKFSERYRLPLHSNEQTTAEAWSAIRGAIEARNKMAHGVWMTIDLKTPIVVSSTIHPSSTPSGLNANRRKHSQLG